MLNKYRCLEKLAARRTDEIVISTMGAAKPWEALSDTDLDFASVDSAMGHAADFALGLAMARPERRVITLNGDGSMLMCLGTLVTIAQHPCPNYAMIVLQNGQYEVTGNQVVPGSSFVDYEAIARGACIENVVTIDNESDFEKSLDLVFIQPGTSIFIWKIEPANEPVPKFVKGLADRAERLRKALV